MIGFEIVLLLFLLRLLCYFAMKGRMKMRIKFNKDDKTGLNKRWIRTILLVMGILFGLKIILPEILELLKPEGYERIIPAINRDMLSDSFFCVMAFAGCFIIKKSKPV